MFYYTYILENSGRDLYIGQTNNIDNRLARHNKNQIQSTKNKGPWHVIFTKEHATRSESVRYETYLKSLKNPDYIKRVIIDHQAVRHPDLSGHA